MNVKHFHWVCSWIADLIQHPETPKGVCLVPIGDKGIGKTFFGELICALLGEKYTWITADKNDIFGPFNGHLGKLIFLVLEEAVWAANHQNEFTLKVLITGKRRSSHGKNKENKQVANYLRNLILANPGWVVPMGQDDRRYFVLSPPYQKMKDFEYFGKLENIIHSGGLQHLMYYFEHYRIGKGGIYYRQVSEGEFDPAKGMISIQGSAPGECGSQLNQPSSIGFFAPVKERNQPTRGPKDQGWRRPNRRVKRAISALAIRGFHFYWHCQMLRTC